MRVLYTMTILQLWEYIESLLQHMSLFRLKKSIKIRTFSLLICRAAQSPLINLILCLSASQQGPESDRVLVTELQQMDFVVHNLTKSLNSSVLPARLKVYHVAIIS